jgi:hypothetical protein
MWNAHSSAWLTSPDRPKIRISPRPMTNGGVMIGSTDSVRSAFLKRKAVRVTISANARPSAVDAVAHSTARISVFHATPQPDWPATQPSDHIFCVKSRSENASSDSAPCASASACPMIAATG